MRCLIWPNCNLWIVLLFFQVLLISETFILRSMSLWMFVYWCLLPLPFFMEIVLSHELSSLNASAGSLLQT